MKDPERLLDSGSALERSLLSSSDDLPSADLERRVLAAMSAVPVAAPPTSPGIGRWFSTRTVTVGLASVVVGALVIGAMLRRDAPPSPPRASSPATPSVAVAAVVAQPASPAKDDGPVMTPDALPNAPAARANAASPSARASATPVPSTAASASIAREIELLDAVKTQLGAGSAADASRALDAYDREFPQGTLRPEATVLRIRTLLLAGDRARAEKVGNDFIAKQPNGVHAKRVRALLEEK